MEYKIVSTRELSDADISKIKDIVTKSMCPNESLCNTFSDCIGIDCDVIIIGSSGGKYSYSFSV